MFTVFVEFLVFFKQYLLFLFTFNTANEINQLSKFLQTDYSAIANDFPHLSVGSMIKVRNPRLFSP